MKLCFFCYTPFHVFNAINVKYNMYLNDSADLYLYNSISGGTDILFENLKNTGIFSNVYNIDNLRWKHYSKLKKLFHIHERLFRIDKKKINAKRNYKKIKKANRVYDEVWSYGSEIELYLLLGISLQNNANTKYRCYEEGEGCYRLPCTNALKDDEITLLSDRWNIMMPDIPEQMLFYLPSCVSPIINAPIGKMPTVTKKMINEVYPNVWDCLKTNYDYSVYFMALGDYDQSLTFAVYDKLKSFTDINFIVKAHPRFMSPFDGKGIEMLECGTTPWEIVCGMIEDIDSKLLIGVYSTALITAKSVYEREPYIIFLNEMDLLKENQRITKEKEEFLEGFIETYSEKSKLFFPKNLEELLDCISYWRKKVNNAD